MFLELRLFLSISQTSATGKHEGGVLGRELQDRGQTWHAGSRTVRSTGSIFHEMSISSAFSGPSFPQLPLKGQVKGPILNFFLMQH